MVTFGFIKIFTKLRKINFLKYNYSKLSKRFGILLSIVAITLLILAAGPYAAKKNRSQAVKTIVIDAGHGGKDPGALGKNAKEKTIALGIAMKLGKYIEDYLPDVEVIYTRKNDVFIELDERAKIANRNNADVFVSVHVNSTPEKVSKALGTETYVMGLHKNQSNLDLAIRENSVIKFEEDFETAYEGFDPESDESYIIFDIYQSVFQKNSLDLAGRIQDQFKNRVGRVNRGVKMAGLLVLWKTTMPSVLVEVGFITNPKEEEYISSERGQALIASGIFRAVRGYKNDVESLNTDDR